MSKVFTTRSMAELLSDLHGTDIPEWKVRRLYEDCELPAAPRHGGKRLIFSADVPQIVEAMKARGWLPANEVVAAEA